MSETRTVYDPFLGKDVEVSNRLTDRLRGKYANGPILPNGEPEFGWSEFPTPPIQREAADLIDLLQAALKPFADAITRAEKDEPTNPGHRLECCRTDLTLYEFAQARSALSTTMRDTR